jgi:hypothetical protein
MPNDHETQGGTEEQSSHEAGLTVANELIGFANAKLEQGVDPVIVADGMRHAAANFTAFAALHAGEEFLSPDQVAQEFHSMLAYYAERHTGEQPPMTGLEKLVETVKNE